MFDDVKQVMETFQSDIISDLSGALSAFWPVVVIVIGGLLAFIIAEEIIDLVNYHRHGRDNYDGDYKDDEY